jgi:single-strand DNA-binding protein
LKNIQRSRQDFVRKDGEQIEIKSKCTILKQTVMNIIGRLTRDAQVRTLSNEKQVVNFSIATNDNYRNKQGERIEQTTYFDCSYWISPKVAEILTKGALVELNGRAYTSAWIGKDGEARAGLNFLTSQIKLHSSSKKEDNSTPSKNKSENPKSKSAENDKEDDLPF